MNKEINVKHTGKIGDCIYGMPVLKQYGNCNLYLSKERKEFTDKSIKFIKPLLEKQDYVNKVETFEEPQRIDIDITLFRKLSNLKYTHLSWAQLMTFQKYMDLSNKWIHNIKSKEKAKIIISRTRRYYGFFDYKKLLNEVDTSKIGFIGLKEEYKKFCNDFKAVRRINIDSALEAASIIKGSNIYIGNQSGLYAIGEAMKVPRILSICPEAPNVGPIGGEAYTSFDDKDLIKVVKNRI